MEIYRGSFFVLLTLLICAYILKRNDKPSCRKKGHVSERASDRA